MKRSTCNICHFSIKTCVCHYISPVITNKTTIIILQHPSEVCVAKNTVRLLNLQLDNIQIYEGESPSDFFIPQKIATSSHCALLFPGENALQVENIDKNVNPIDTLFVLDGTWKKVNKITMLNPWLNDLPKVSFSQLPENKYSIRKAEQSYSLSTLEACAHFLSCYESLNVKPLHDLLAGMIHEQTKFMPADVKQRYLNEEH
ncbi:DTW domain-containing protein [Pseudoalteromonas luteoviolacea]|uniref:tRNA-uridine aminocarboxypropyltransferase n=1 Tax=Pseudoalteromonas luteoviolacea TaxID=43657 RepID=UPI001B3A122E|nr:tRNA-uridine aminocarboxypropyltransferase [Pseudoalteromonas luteoviolacea]MBQ4877173.1 DTW domain-containing protein [Pseudoalteromonas luteoviolacea]MBQ4906034.1 DTW domain-containing protein [Pseudoalteromonas luteoviolacea]